MPMPRPRAAMRKIREVLRLSLEEKLSRRQVGAAVGLPYTTVADYLSRATRAGLSWPLPEGMDDCELESRLFVTEAFGPPPTEAPKLESRPVPNWAQIHRELRRPELTLQLLWYEYSSGRRRATSTASSAVTTGSGSDTWTRSCAKGTVPGTG